MGALSAGATETVVLLIMEALQLCKYYARLQTAAPFKLSGFA